MKRGMDIIVKPCECMTDAEALEYAKSVFEGTKVDLWAYDEGIKNGTALTYNDGTIAYFYRTKTAYVVRLDVKGDRHNW